MRFEFNIATILCLLTLGTFVGLTPACRDSDSAVVDHEHEDLVCPDGEVVCVLAPDDEGVVRSACADPNTDSQHCGACNTSCADGQSCVDAQCTEGEPTDECDLGLFDCGDEEKTLCVDINNDFEHCGACDNACEAGMERCYDGECVSLCPKGYSTCGAGCCHWESYCDDEETAECITVSCFTGSPCGNGCCGEDEYCGPGSICHDRCEAEETFCGDVCCQVGQVCVAQRCTTR